MYFCSGLRKYSQTKQWRCFQLRPQERHIHLKNAAVHIREPFTGLCEPCVLAHQRRKMEISPSTPLWWFVFLFRTDSECFFFPFRVNWFSACLCSVSQRLWQWRRLQHAATVILNAKADCVRFFFVHFQNRVSCQVPDSQTKNYELMWQWLSLKLFWCMSSGQMAE